MKEFFELQNDFDFKLEGDKLIPTFKNQNQQTLTSDQVDNFTTVKKYSTSVKAYLNNPPQEYSKIVGVDIETTGLDCFKDRIRLIAVYGDDFSYVGDKLQEVEDILSDSTVLKVFHNALFDVSFLKVAGIEVKNYSDTIVMAKIISNSAVFDSLEYLAKKYLNLELDKELQHSGNWQAELTQEHHDYCLKDAEVTLKLFRVLYDLIVERYLFPTYRTEISALPSLIELQTNGMMLDKSELRAYLEKLRVQHQELKERLEIQLACENLNSPPQLLKSLQNLGVPIDNVEEKTLKKQSGMFPIVKELVRYKKLTKVLTTYGKNLLLLIKTDNRVRGNWNLIGTATSRMTCKGPNFQGIPKEIKGFFHATPGHVFVIVDYSTVELRILAEISGCKKLIDAFNQGLDLHYETAKTVLGKEDISDDERQIGKVINFGLIYGLTAYGLMNEINQIPGFNINKEEAQNFIDMYFMNYKGVAKYKNQQLKSPMVTTLGGRYWDSSNGLKLLKDNQRLNYAIQASCAEGLKESLALLMMEKKDTWRLVGAIHDELICEVPEEDAEYAKSVIEKIMINGMRKLVKQVPIEVESHVSKVWTK
ncbi:DNA polymerase [Turicibacter sanguinis]|uniref:DNA polymerase n=2 Tax=Turicibacter sanguinis TaxID=154288 RepID=UPI00232C332A|nr:DNA polymerase [Turicibacter sanguinis]MDB8460377.1 DNA polymerase [Turicibacter sanguinis]